jgi:hypothetical protein
MNKFIDKGKRIKQVIVHLLNQLNLKFLKKFGEVKLFSIFTAEYCLPHILHQTMLELFLQKEYNFPLHPLEKSNLIYFQLYCVLTV